MTHIDAIDLEVVRASLSGIVQEMQNSLFRTGFSTIVRESQDASCALMNTRGEIIAQHVVLPLHIGAFPACAAAVLREFSGAIEDGDAFIINHPYEGGSPHAPDFAVITPVFFQGEFFGLCGSIAHKSDIGGPVPGSCSGQARETFNEGLHLPAVRYERRQVPNLDAGAGAGRHPRPAWFMPARGKSRQRDAGEVRQGQGGRLLRAAVRAGRGQGARCGRRMGGRPL
jgi:N-methylhydantoinase B